MVQKCTFFPRALKKNKLPPLISNFYSCTIVSSHARCGPAAAPQMKLLQRVIVFPLPCLDELDLNPLLRRATKMTPPTQESSSLLSMLRVMQARTKRLELSFSPHGGTREMNLHYLIRINIHVL